MIVAGHAVRVSIIRYEYWLKVMVDVRVLDVRAFLQYQNAT